MRKRHAFLGLIALALTSSIATEISPSQATSLDEASPENPISIGGITPGLTPFIARVQVVLAQPDNLREVEFRIRPKSLAKARAVRTVYDAQYLRSRGFFQNGRLIVPIHGLYDNYNNTVDLKFRFHVGRETAQTVIVPAAAFVDPCGWSRPQVVVARNDIRLSYDYFIVQGVCANLSPVILDTDGELRWVSTDGGAVHGAAFYNNSIYRMAGSQLLKVELDGSVELVADYNFLGLTGHHNLDPGKRGIILEVDRTNIQIESAMIEVALDGRILKTWYLDEIIARAMVAGGDDPSQFVRPWPEDWFHMNSAVYWPQDDSVVISSRENFVICLDYQTNAIKWIYGDETKHWYQFPSLRAFALQSLNGALAPIGQHSLSITSDNQLLLFNNGRASLWHDPPGIDRGYSVGSKYLINGSARTATETYRHAHNPILNSLYCSSIYQDKRGGSYLVDYAFVVNVPPPPGSPLVAVLQGTSATGQTAFEYRYGTVNCDLAYNSVPVHLEAFYYPAPSAPGP